MSMFRWNSRTFDIFKSTFSFSHQKTAHIARVYQASISIGPQVPQDLHHIPRTIFLNPQKPNLNKFYDQIAWFTEKKGTPALSMKHIKSGHYNFTKTALSTLNLTKKQLSWRISDHYPLWTEFSLEN